MGAVWGQKDGAVMTMTGSFSTIEDDKARWGPGVRDADLISSSPRTPLRAFGSAPASPLCTGGTPDGAIGAARFLLVPEPTLP